MICVNKVEVTYVHGMLFFLKYYLRSCQFPTYIAYQEDKVVATTIEFILYIVLFNVKFIISSLVFMGGIGKLYLPKMPCVFYSLTMDNGWGMQHAMNL